MDGQDGTRDVPNPTGPSRLRPAVLAVLALLGAAGGSILLLSTNRPEGRARPDGSQAMQQAQQEKQFVSELTAAIQELLPGKTFDFNEAEFSVRVGDNTTLHLTNVFRSWQGLGAPERRKLIENAIGAPHSTATAVPSSFSEAAPRLMPKIRDLATRGIAALGAELQNAKAAMVVERPLGEHLRIIVVYDGGTYFADVTEENLAKWGRKAEETIATAIANFKASNRDARFHRIMAGVYVADAHDNFDSSRLLLDDAIGLLELRGRPLAFPVHRDFLAITGDEDPDGIKKVAEMMEEERTNPYPISVIPLRFESGHWSTFRLLLTTAAGRTLESYRVREYEQIYEEQKGLLEKLAEPRHDDAYVASFDVIEDNERGFLDSYSTWGDGLPTLLPITGQIGFVSDPTSAKHGLLRKMFSKKKPWVAMARFEDALRVAGHRMKKIEGDPPRYRVESFPTAEEFKAMGAVEVRGKASPKE
ncbi:MAG: hypothetical protein HY901_13855 [Deltaproteobacteria bacterium]|nr:hypothetical protein [Deltaproteobacteria bacterium]